MSDTLKEIISRKLKEIDELDKYAKLCRDTDDNYEAWSAGEQIKDLEREIDAELRIERERVYNAKQILS